MAMPAVLYLIVCVLAFCQGESQQGNGMTKTGETLGIYARSLRSSSWVANLHPKAKEVDSWDAESEFSPWFGDDRDLESSDPVPACPAASPPCEDGEGIFEESSMAGCCYSISRYTKAKLFIGLYIGLIIGLSYFLRVGSRFFNVFEGASQPVSKRGDKWAHKSRDLLDKKKLFWDKGSALRDFWYYHCNNHPIIAMAFTDPDHPVGPWKRRVLFLFTETITIYAVYKVRAWWDVVELYKRLAFLIIIIGPLNGLINGVLFLLYAMPCLHDKYAEHDHEVKLLGLKKTVNLVGFLTTLPLAAACPYLCYETACQIAVTEVSDNPIDVDNMALVYILSHVSRWAGLPALDYFMRFDPTPGRRRTVRVCGKAVLEIGEWQDQAREGGGGPEGFDFFQGGGKWADDDAEKGNLSSTTSSDDKHTAACHKVPANQIAPTADASGNPPRGEIDHARAPLGGTGSGQPPTPLPRTGPTTDDNTSMNMDEKRMKMDQSSASDESYYAADSVVERESSKIDILPNRLGVVPEDSMFGNQESDDQASFSQSMQDQRSTTVSNPPHQPRQSRAASVPEMRANPPDQTGTRGAMRVSTQGRIRRGMVRENSMMGNTLRAPQSREERKNILLSYATSPSLYLFT